MVIRVVVADDNDDVRSALCSLLIADGRFVVAAEAASGPAAVAAVELERPDAVLLDVRMPGGGVEAAHAIQATRRPVAVIALSAQVTAALVAAMVRAGARGVLLKGRIGCDLPDIVARCTSGEVILATPVAAAALKIFAGPGGECPDL